MEIVKTGMTSLAEILQRVSTAAYQARLGGRGLRRTARPRAAPGSPDDGGAARRAGDGAAADEETVEGEFKEV